MLCAEYAVLIGKVRHEFYFVLGEPEVGASVGRVTVFDVPVELLTVAA